MTSPTVAKATTASVWMRTRPRVEREERRKYAHREDPEQELPAVADVLVDDEAAERPGGDGHECHEGQPAAHRAHLRRSGGCGSIEG